VFKNASERKMFVGEPRKRWLNSVENDLKKIAVRGCRKTAKDRDAWKLILRKAGQGATWTAEPVERDAVSANK
jgi:hypothetical protein